MPTIDAGLSRYFGLQDAAMLLTGATGGIGRVMAEAFAVAGARPVLSSDEADACRVMASDFERAVGGPSRCPATSVIRWFRSDAHEDAGCRIPRGVDAPAAPISAKCACAWALSTWLNSAALGGMSKSRIRVPLLGGAQVSCASKGSPLARSIDTGVCRVFHTS